MVGPPAGFTMVEIAISLAIIGIALVAIIGVLPLGMNVQRDNREATVINQDASVFLEAIRNGSLGLNDLTNYVFDITNSWTLYKTDGTVQGTGVNGYTYNTVSISSPVPPYSSGPSRMEPNIVGLLSTPEFIADIFNPPFTIIPPFPAWLMSPSVMASMPLVSATMSSPRCVPSAGRRRKNRRRTTRSSRPMPSPIAFIVSMRRWRMNIPT